MAKEPKKIDTENYQGPGRVGQSFVTATTWGTIGWGVGTAVVGAGFLKGIANHVGRAATQAAPKIRGRYVMGAGLLVAPLAVLIGTVRGWGKASKTQEQFEALKTERNDAIKAKTDLEAKVTALGEEVAGHRETTKLFTEMHKSRAEQGGNAAVLDNEKSTSEVGNIR